MRRLPKLFAILLFAVAGFAQMGPPPEPPPKPAAILAGVQEIPDLVFASPNGHALKLDLFLPEKPEGMLPVVAWIYSGGFMTNNQKQQEAEAAWLTRHGYAVAAIDYRLSGEALFPAQIEDCEAAMRWLRANAAKYGLDAQHIGAWGGSSGGNLAAMLGTSGGVKDLEGTGGNASESSRV